MEDRYKKIEEIVRKELACSAHDMDHIMRVYNLAINIANYEINVNLEVLQAAVLLHDIARAKEDADNSGGTDHAILGAEMSYPILKSLGFAEDKIRHIQDCIIQHRYRSENEPQTIEAKILFDADKLDSIGCIGIGRSFMWAGKNNAKIYRDIGVNEYAKENLGGKINGRIQDKTRHSFNIEFLTKLRFVKNRLYTKKAKEIGEDRHTFYEMFLNRLEKEIKGEL